MDSYHQTNSSLAAQHADELALRFGLSSDVPSTHQLAVRTAPSNERSQRFVPHQENSKKLAQATSSLPFSGNTLKVDDEASLINRVYKPVSLPPSIYAPPPKSEAPMFKSMPVVETKNLDTNYLPYEEVSFPTLSNKKMSIEDVTESSADRDLKSMWVAGVIDYENTKSVNHHTDILLYERMFHTNMGPNNTRLSDIFAVDKQNVAPGTAAKSGSSLKDKRSGIEIPKGRLTGADIARLRAINQQVLADLTQGPVKSLDKLKTSPFVTENARIRRVLALRGDVGQRKARGMLAPQTVTLQSSVLNNLLLLERLEARAAIVIQRFYRRILRLRLWHRFSKELGLIVRIQRWAREMLARRTRKVTLREQRRVALALQARVRGRNDRRRIQEEVDLENSAASVIQRMWRLRLFRLRVRRQLWNRSATAIQRVWRGARARARCDRLYLDACATLIQARVRAFLVCRHFRRTFKQETDAAVLIQSIFRGWRAREKRNRTLFDLDSSFRRSWMALLKAEEAGLRKEAASARKAIAHARLREKLQALTDEWEEGQKRLHGFEFDLVSVQTERVKLSPRAIEQGWAAQLERDQQNLRLAVTEAKSSLLFGVALRMRQTAIELGAADARARRSEARANELADAWVFERTALWSRENEMHWSEHYSELSKRESSERRKWAVRFYTAGGKVDYIRNSGIRNRIRNQDRSRLLGNGGPQGGMNYNIRADNHPDSLLVEELDAEPRTLTIAHGNVMALTRPKQKDSYEKESRIRAQKIAQRARMRQLLMEAAAKAGAYLDHQDLQLLEYTDPADDVVYLPDGRVAVDADVWKSRYGDLSEKSDEIPFPLHNTDQKYLTDSNSAGHTITDGKVDDSTVISDRNKTSLITTNSNGNKTGNSVGDKSSSAPSTVPGAVIKRPAPKHDTDGDEKDDTSSSRPLDSLPGVSSSAAKATDAPATGTNVGLMIQGAFGWSIAKAAVRDEDLNDEMMGMSNAPSDAHVGISGLSGFGDSSNLAPSSASVTRTGAAVVPPLGGARNAAAAIARMQNTNPEIVAMLRGHPLQTHPQYSANMHYGGQLELSSSAVGEKESFSGAEARLKQLAFGKGNVHDLRRLALNAHRVGRFSGPGDDQTSAAATSTENDPAKGQLALVTAPSGITGNELAIQYDFQSLQPTYTLDPNDPEGRGALGPLRGPLKPPAAPVLPEYILQARNSAAQEASKSVATTTSPAEQDHVKSLFPLVGRAAVSSALAGAVAGAVEARSAGFVGSTKVTSTAADLQQARMEELQEVGSTAARIGDLQQRIMAVNAQAQLLQYGALTKPLMEGMGVLQQHLMAADGTAKVLQTQDHARQKILEQNENRAKGLREEAHDRKRMNLSHDRTVEQMEARKKKEKEREKKDKKKTESPKKKVNDTGVDLDLDETGNTLLDSQFLKTAVIQEEKLKLMKDAVPTHQEAPSLVDYSPVDVHTSTASNSMGGSTGAHLGSSLSGLSSSSKLKNPKEMSSYDLYSSKNGKGSATPLSIAMHSRLQSMTTSRPVSVGVGEDDSPVARARARRRQRVREEHEALLNQNLNPEEAAALRARQEEEQKARFEEEAARLRKQQEELRQSVQKNRQSGGLRREVHKSSHFVKLSEVRRPGDTVGAVSFSGRSASARAESARSSRSNRSLDGGRAGGASNSGISTAIVNELDAEEQEEERKRRQLRQDKLKRMGEAGELDVPVKKLDVDIDDESADDDDYEYDDESARLKRAANSKKLAEQWNLSEELALAKMRAIEQKRRAQDLNPVRITSKNRRASVVDVPKK